MRILYLLEVGMHKLAFSEWVCLDINKFRSIWHKIDSELTAKDGVFFNFKDIKIDIVLMFGEDERYVMEQMERRGIRYQ